LGVGLLKSDSQTLLRPTLVAMTTKICEFQHKMAITQPCIKDYNLLVQKYSPDGTAHAL